LAIKIPKNPIDKASVPIKYQIEKIIAVEMMQTKNEFPKDAFDILPIFFAKSHNIKPPITEQIRKK
jgi:hypothetical protein